MAYTFPLLPDICDVLVACLHDDPSILRILRLVCKDFYVAALPHFFRTTRVVSTNSPLYAVVQAPDVARHVCHAIISIPTKDVLLALPNFDRLTICIPAGPPPRCNHTAKAISASPPVPPSIATRKISILDMTLSREPDVRWLHDLLAGICPRRLALSFTADMAKDRPLVDFLSQCDLFRDAVQIVSLHLKCTYVGLGHTLSPATDMISLFLSKAQRLAHLKEIEITMKLAVRTIHDMELMAWPNFHQCLERAVQVASQWVLALIIRNEIICKACKFYEECKKCRNWGIEMVELACVKVNILRGNGVPVNIEFYSTKVYNE